VTAVPVHSRLFATASAEVPAGEKPCPAPSRTTSSSTTAARRGDRREIKTAEAARIPLGRRGEPDEVATWIPRLADAHSAWLTGQVLTVGGGFEPG
jgi:NAD(P)-dependent dehydrogenase (short-subunit alcohol dehydrogenase family)